MRTAIAIVALAFSSVAHAQCGEILNDGFGFQVVRTMELDDDVLLTGMNDWIFLFDCSDPVAPAHLSTIPSKNFMRDIVVRDHIAYLIQGRSLAVVDIADPTAPVELFFIDNAPPLFISAALYQDFLFVGELNGIINVFSIADPAEPVLVTTFDVGNGDVSDMEFQGDRLFVASEGSWHIVDVSDPTAPVILGVDDTNAVSIEVAGNTVFVHWSLDHPRVYIFDATDPANPVEIGLWNVGPSGKATKDMVYKDDVLYLAAYRAMRLLDVSDPSNPTLICEHDQERNNFAVDIIIDDTIAYVSGGHDILTFDLSDVVPCGADINDDGVLDLTDFVAFQEAFFAGDHAADCNNDLQLTVLDFVCYQLQFQTGCP